MFKNGKGNEFDNKNRVVRIVVRNQSVKGRKWAVEDIINE